MKKVYSHKEKRKLEAGKIMDFLIVKTIILPDEQEYFVVQDVFEDRHLVPAGFYRNYYIKPGEKYKFHVDKINCKGQLFLEPLHPEYKIGEKYEFKYLKMIKEVDKKGNEVCYHVMKGKRNYLAHLEASDLKIQKGTWGIYKVVKIKKAKVFLELG